MPLLFSYGTLQQPDVQQATFGRLLDGAPDELPGYERSVIAIADERYATPTGPGRHAIVRPSGRDEDRVPGTALELTDDELAQADAYEPAEYARVAVTLASGREAWVYADARAS